jgi:capsular polysaccharide biosynthesis protein
MQILTIALEVFALCITGLLIAIGTILIRHDLKEREKEDEDIHKRTDQWDE